MDMDQLRRLRRRNTLWAICIMVLSVPALFLLYAALIHLGSAAYFLGWLMPLALGVLLAGSIRAYLRARSRLNMIDELPPPSAHGYMLFASLPQLVSFGGNLLVLIIPPLVFLLAALTSGNDNNATSGLYGSSILVIGLVAIGPFFAFAAASTLSALWWRLPTRVAEAELYALRHKQGAYRLIITARVINSALVVLGLLALVLFSLRGSF